jgi:hypothetical protein
VFIPLHLNCKKLFNLEAAGELQCGDLEAHTHAAQAPLDETRNDANGAGDAAPYLLHATAGTCCHSVTHTHSRVVSGDTSRTLCYTASISLSFIHMYVSPELELQACFQVLSRHAKQCNKDDVYTLHTTEPHARHHDSSSFLLWTTYRKSRSIR